MEQLSVLFSGCRTDPLLDTHNHSKAEDIDPGTVHSLQADADSYNSQRRQKEKEVENPNLGLILADRLQGGSTVS